MHAVDRQRAAGQFERGLERGLGEGRRVVDLPGADGEARQQRDVAVAAAASPDVMPAKSAAQLDHHGLIIGLGERGHVRRKLGQDTGDGFQPLTAAEADVVGRKTDEHGKNIPERQG